MPNIYLKIPARNLIPGASFLFRPEDHLQCTALKITQTTITYVRQQDEENHKLKDLTEAVYVLHDEHRQKTIKEFTNSLTNEETGLFKLLMKVKANSIWGYAIRLELLRPNKDGFYSLLANMSSQAKDDPESFKRMVGEELTIRLLGYLA